MEYELEFFQKTTAKKWSQTSISKKDEKPAEEKDYSGMLLPGKELGEK